MFVEQKQSDTCYFYTCKGCGLRVKMDRQIDPSIIKPHDCEKHKNGRRHTQASAPTPEAQRQAWLTEHGCGAQLHRIIKKYTGEGITSDCQCQSRIAKMNVRGPEWCRENVEKIVDWLIEEVDRRLKAAEDAQEPAGWRLRLGGLNLPGRRLVLRRLVLAAVRQAEPTSPDSTGNTSIMLDPIDAW